MGRAAGGVRAISLGKKDRAVGAVALRRTGTSILVATELGYGKRSETEEYRVSHRGGKGIITVRTSDKTGPMVAIKEVTDGDDVVIVTEKGIVIRQHASEIRVAGRNTQGVKLIRLEEKDTIADLAVVLAEEEEVDEEGAAKKGGKPPAAAKEQAELFTGKTGTAQTAAPGKPVRSADKAEKNPRAPETEPPGRKAPSPGPPPKRNAGKKAGPKPGRSGGSRGRKR